MKDAYTITSSTTEEKTFILNSLIAYNAQHVPMHLQPNYEEINLSLKDSKGLVIAGLLARLTWNWMEIEILWVEASSRKGGYGSKLLAEAERIAREKVCSFIKLNTFSFQAPEFYKQHGYELYALLEDAPTGSNHYFFKKALRD